MNFNFENYLLQELHSDKIVVLNEQVFVKNGELEPDKIYVVIKYLTSSIEYGAETTPVQILVLSEQNGLEQAKEIFDAFTQSHNWVSGMFNGSFVKQQYSSPVVMSNFNEAAYGYRSVLYISATLFVMDNVSDVENLELEGVKIKPINFNWSYQMTGNTQAVGNEKLASTVKNISTFSATMSLPVLNTYINEDGFLFDVIEGPEESVSSDEHELYVEVEKGYFITATIASGTITEIDQENGIIKYNSLVDTTITYNYIGNNLLSVLLKISAGKLSGNITLNLKFTVFNVNFDLDCKLVTLQMTSLPNNVPAISVGLQR